MRRESARSSSLAPPSTFVSPDEQQLHGDGFWVGVAHDEDELLRAATRLGAPVPVRHDGPILQELTPIEAGDAPEHSLSSAHGVGAFPFHTDAAHHRHPPRWVVMRCADPGAEHRPTLLADARALGLVERQWRILERTVWWVRSGGRGFPTSIVKRAKDGIRVRYDRGCMTPADPGFAPAGELFEQALHQTSHIRLEWQHNDMVIIDNWRMLHARAAAEGLDAGSRRLQRILVT